jgi:hypothetical protein
MFVATRAASGDRVGAVILVRMVPTPDGVTTGKAFSRMKELLPKKAPDAKLVSESDAIIAGHPAKQLVWTGKDPDHPTVPIETTEAVLVRKGALYDIMCVTSPEQHAKYADAISRVIGSFQLIEH